MVVKILRCDFGEFRGVRLACVSDSLVDYVIGLLHGQGPLASAPKFQIRYAHLTSLGRHQLYIVIVANAYAWL